VSALSLVGTPIGLRVMGVGLFAIIVAVGLALFRHRKLVEIVSRIVSLASGGHIQEARVLARASGRWARPLVAALGGERPEISGFAVGIDVAFAALASLGIMHGALSAVAMRVLPQEAGMATDVGALLASMALLTPLTLIAIAAILRVGAQSRRRVRTAGVEVVVRQLNAPASPAARARALKEAR
jgi:hypothetical protein